MSCVAWDGWVDDRLIGPPTNRSAAIFGGLIPIDLAYLKTQAQGGPQGPWPASGIVQGEGASTSTSTSKGDTVIEGQDGGPRAGTGAGAGAGAGAGSAHGR